MSMPTEQEIERGSWIVIDSIFDSLKPDDYDSYVADKKAASASQHSADTSPLISTNEYLTQVYRILNKAISEYDWKADIQNAIDVYNHIGERSMTIAAFETILKIKNRALLSKSLPELKDATYADGAYVAHQVQRDKLEWLYKIKVKNQQLAEYARALEDEMKGLKFDPYALQNQSRLYKHFGIGSSTETIISYINPFMLYNQLWKDNT